MASAATASAPAIVAKGASKLFLDGAVVAFHQLSLEVRRNEILCVVGPSGCGKTTLLRCIAGLTDLSDGEILVQGKPVLGRPPDGVAMVFQEFNLLPWRTARSNVEMPLEVLGIDAGRRPDISARALAIDPTYLFMDEPFGALDPQIREMMQIELMKIWDQAHVPAKAGPGLDPGWQPVRRQDHAQGEIRKTVLFVTHSVDEAVFLSDRVVVFGGQPGRIIADIAIDLPRPRWRDEEALKRSPQFLEYRHAIWHMLKQQLGAMPESITVTLNGE